MLCTYLLVLLTCLTLLRVPRQLVLQVLCRMHIRLIWPGLLDNGLGSVQVLYVVVRVSSAILLTTLLSSFWLVCYFNCIVHRLVPYYLLRFRNVCMVYVAYCHWLF